MFKRILIPVDGSDASGEALPQALGLAADSALFDDPRARLGESVRNAAMLWNADLIVTGSHGRRGVGRALLGSGAEDIVRQAPVPVLVIRSGTSRTNPEHLQ